MIQLKNLPDSNSKINWDDLDDQVDSPSSSSEPLAAASPPTAWLDDRDMPMYGAAPMEQSVPIIRCPECEKPILASALSGHKPNCEKIKKLNAKNKKDLAVTTGSKRKAEDDGPVEVAGGPPKKKGKKELAKTGGTKRIKGPASLDKHCCVINEKGQPCSRSITCKVHSMVAKRAVQGRSKPYDELLIEWKKENIPGWVEPVKKETKAERKAKKEAEKEAKRLELLAQGIVPGQKKPKAPKGEPGAKKVKKSEKAAGQAGDKTGKKTSTKPGQAPPNPNGEEDEEDEDLDSDVEFENLVRAVRVAKPFTAE
ncbi:hypothetical protein FS837_007719 [Tulasnella sp. UAMH 9824]|nr:hypothetical protein FS837_007719 [Tulasnella sp. UAMH 9824]